MRPSEFSRDDPGTWGSRRQAQLALRGGGEAFAALEHTHPAALLGSFSDCLPSLLLILGTPAACVLTLLRHPDLRSQSAARATLSEVSSAWGTPTTLPTFKRMKKNRINSVVYRALSQGSADSTAGAAASTGTQTALGQGQHILGGN